jgi:hypothetical protein
VNSWNDVRQERAAQLRQQRDRHDRAEAHAEGREPSKPVERTEKSAWWSKTSIVVGAGVCP